MESWDDEDFEPTQLEKPDLRLNKWEGEDEEDDVKENWEDEEEEEAQKDEKGAESKGMAVQQPKKKSIAEKIAEKERLKREEYERRMKEKEEELTPEEQIKMQKESDLILALETTFGDTNNVDGSSTTTLDEGDPITREEFIEFANVMTRRLYQQHGKKAEYMTFLENLVRNLCVTQTSFDIKKVKTTIDNLYLEKQKLEKGDKVKKGGKGKGKAKLKLEDENQFSAYVDDYTTEYDDFM